MGALSVIPEAIGRGIQLEADREVARQNMAELDRSTNAEKANAVAALQRGSRQAGLVKQQASQLAAKQQVALAANGLDTSQGTAADLMASTDAYGRLDAATSLNNARAEAFGHARSATSYRVERDKLKRRWQDGGLIGGSADDEHFFGVASDALGAAMKLGMG